MGPIAPATTDEELRTRSPVAAATTPPFTVRLRRADALHAEHRRRHADRSQRADSRAARADQVERASYEAPRFTFTPHVHAQLLSGARPRALARAAPRSHSTIRSSIDSIQAYRAIDLTRTTQSARPSAHRLARTMTDVPHLLPAHRRRFSPRSRPIATRRSAARSSRSPPSTSRRHAQRDGRVSTRTHRGGLSPRDSTSRCRAPAARSSRSSRGCVPTCIPDCNHLYHPRYVGHQVAAPLPAAVWMESSPRR